MANAPQQQNPGNPHDNEESHDHDQGLLVDLGAIVNRRRALTLLGGATALGAATLVACGGSDSATTSTSAAAASSTTVAGTVAAGSSSTTSTAAGNTTEAIPEETGGPFPGDGSNGVNVLTESGVVRSDITSSFGASTTTAQGVPLTVTLKVLDVANSGAPLAGAAIYAWHCDKDGNYSLYSDGVTNENYLRGVQETDADGLLTFQTIYPGAYSGRWPHIHFEVFPSLAAATSAGSKLRTSQLALPEDVSQAVYATTGYESSVRNLAGTSLDSDMVFSDGYSLQMATVTGTVDSGLVATLNVPV